MKRTSLSKTVLSAAILASVAAGVRAEGPTVSGFVDVGYNYNFNGMSANTYRAFDSQANSFTLQNAEIVVSGKSDSEVAYRVDVGYGNDAGVVSSFDGSGDDQINLQQAFIAIPCPLTNGTLTAGKFVTPFGAEVIESKDNYNSSRGLLFTNAIPLVHTGLKYDKGFMEGKLGLSGGVVNGWDSSSDVNKGKSLFLQSSYNLSKFSFILGGMYGPESASAAYSTTPAASTEKFGRGLVDAIVKFVPTDKLTLVANVDYGVEEGAPYEPTATDDTTANWAGIALYANYLFTDTLSGALRYENFDDEGSRLTATSPIHQVINSYTATLQKKYKDVIARAEFRTDMSTDKVYMKDDGSADDSETTVGFNLIYAF